MPSVQVPKKEWEDFLDSFSQMHEDWMVRVEETGPDIEEDRNVLIDEGAFRGVSLAEDSAPDLIMVGAGTKPNKHLSHSVENAIRVVVERDERGADRALRLESADGRTTTVTFLRTQPPEMMNGV